MSTVCQADSDSVDSKKETNSLSMGDEDFYVLKFPHKLWRIVNECDTGAIQWGIYGKTILIDYNLFQAQYLECEVPKFKTRNMTSFVRQLNMYGFKKMQTQVKSDSSRCCNIHEFFHNFFRFGRYDLLDSVKRRPTPVKNSRAVQHLEYHNQSRLQMCRAAFAKALQESKDRLRQGNRTFSVIPQDGLDAAVTGHSEEYKFQVIPVETSLKDIVVDGSVQDLTMEVSSSFRDYIDMHPEMQDSRNETDNSSVEEETTCEVQDIDLESMETENSLHYLEQTALKADNHYFLDVNKTSMIRKNHSVRVKKGFDGTNYVIDLMVDCPDEPTMENVSTEVLETELYHEEENKEIEIPSSECMIVINSSPNEENHTVTSHQDEERDLGNGDEEFYDSITKTYLGI